VLIDDIDGFETRTLSENNISGSNLELVIRGYVSFNTEYYHLDNLNVDYANVSNQSPEVSLTSPTNGTVFTEPADVTIDVEASDSDGSIDKVELRNNSELLGTETSSPYSFSLTKLTNGNYSLEARAYDNEGATSNFAITITVNTATLTESSDYKNILLYPNPATDQVYINCPSEYSISSINAQGISVMDRTNLIGLQLINIKNMNSGLYIVKITSKKIMSHF